MVRISVPARVIDVDRSVQAARPVQLTEEQALIRDQIDQCGDTAFVQDRKEDASVGKSRVLARIRHEAEGLID
jgi:hypothetical protein